MNTAFIQQALEGDRRAIGRAISALENGGESAYAIRHAMAAKQGRAHVIGVTGPPGGGKSTLVSAMIRCLRERGLTVAVAAVDPSSPFTGGAVLGDRIRMGDRQSDEGVFIRSLASRGHLGGLATAASDVIDLFDASGFDVVIVETVGAGQSEVEITRYADTKIVVCPPGLGDDVQAIKAGILEIADVFVVTKSDLPDSRKTEADLRAMLALRKEKNALPEVLKVVATTGEGVDTLVQVLTQRTARGVRHEIGGAREAYRQLSKYIAADNVANLLGMELVAASKGSTTLRMKVQRKHINFNGKCHGGILFSLGDMALGLACNSHGQLATLVDGQLSISTAVDEGDWLIAHAYEVSRSRKIGSYQVRISRASDDAHIALIHGTVYVLDRPPVGANDE
ncbi:methylmalonyl Co-A mutase-associated GTPase MeaB [Diaphorobacter sp. HDW4A]|uniref:methylmalonyl Co-A mutase-associated GTPase MeaB n=1 Tax=Diaphorobacter sp. HDW4A TaxID=2714924 RepID=UPI00140961E1|nr:methylmalonyl Co-A mutase-associated GTPase MeaB [Diaphorobacter sp. HDW4A]QIL79466.1 methylmalonyl Co-A mutase-associated GTPase MeaB [Diaphorobacter sp. HDW4A]